MDFLKDSVYQYIGASTAHWKFDKAVTEMLYGKINSKVHLSIKTPKGKRKDIELTRNYLQNKREFIMADTAYTVPITIKYLKTTLYIYTYQLVLEIKLEKSNKSFIEIYQSY